MGSLHCLNVGFGDATIIISDLTAFLVDCHNIENFSYLLPTIRHLRGVFITHQHKDHYSGLVYLKNMGFTIDYLIYSPYKRRSRDNSVTIEEWIEFNSLRDYFRNRGAELYAPYRQSSFDEVWWSINGIKFWIIGPHTGIANRESKEIHDASLVIKADLGQRSCLFAGDASDISLEYIASNTENYCNDILHASHHGSLNGAHLDFIKKCNAEYTLISTRSGVYNNIPHLTALRRYREYTNHDVRRTDIDGSWRWDF